MTDRPETGGQVGQQKRVGRMTQAHDLPKVSTEVVAGLALDEIEGRHANAGGSDIFQRISHFQLAAQARAAGLYPFFQPIEVNEGNEAVVNGRRGQRGKGTRARAEEVPGGSEPAGRGGSRSRMG